MEKFRFALILVMVFAILLVGCQPGSEPEEVYELTTVTINDSTQVNYAPIYFAEANGYFEDYGIQLEVLTFNRVTEAIPLLASGQLDVYAGSISAGLLNTFGQEPNVKAVADRGKIVEGGCTFQALLVRKDLYDSGVVRGPEDFSGLLVAATPTATRGFHLSRFLEKGGLTFDDVEITDLPSASYFDALDNKAIDVIITPELVLTRLIEYGNVVVLSKAEDEIGPYQSSILAFGQRLIQQDPDLGVRFLAAYLKGVQKYNEGKTEENLAFLAEKTGEDIELLRKSCWVPIRDDGLIDFNEVDPFQQWSKEMGQLDETITEEQFWDPSFLEAAKALIASEDTSK